MTSSPGPEDGALSHLRAALTEAARALAAVEARLAASAAAAAATPAEDPAPSVAALEEIATIPVAGLEVSEVTALAVDRVGRLVETDRAMVLLVGEPSGPLVARSARGFRRDDLPHVVVEPGEGVIGRAFLAGRVVVRRADESDPFVDRFPVSEAVAVPLRAEDEIVGVLFAGRRAGGAFGATDVLALAALAERVGAALGAARLRDRRRQEFDRLRHLARFVRESHVGRDLRDVLASAAETGAMLLGTAVGLVALAADGEGLAVVATHGLARANAALPDFRRRKGLVGEALDSGEPVVAGDLHARHDPEALTLMEAGVRGILVVPLTRHGVEGALCLGDREPRDFTVEDVGLAQLVADAIGVAAANHRAVGDMRDDMARQGSVHDRLIQAERARALGDMASGLAGQLSQVFARILGKSQALRGRAQDDVLREGLGSLEEAAWDGADVVRRLESLSEPGVDTVDSADLRSLTQEVLAEIRSRIDEVTAPRGSRPEIVSDLQAVPPVAVTTALLREAVSNLLLNALDAMPAGGRLTVGLRERDRGAELVVADTGEGIAETVRPRIFEPFFTTRSSLRLGLGLTMVHGLVSRLHGRIDVASRPGVGTIVTIWLPGASPVQPPAVVTATRPTPSGDEAPSPATSACLEAASILVLEDEEPARAALVEALKAAGYRVVSAADGPTGLAMLHTVRFDLVLADLALPQRSGLAIARSVKRVSPDTVVVLMTGWGHLLEPERLREQGVDLMLVKPFRTERLLAVVEEGLRLQAGP
jgi:signal transduction histidine kinase/CheY-like chemotaxis protein